MPAKQLDEAIIELEMLLDHYEKMLDTSISNGEILGKAKIILHNLNEVSKKLHELKRVKDISNKN